MTQFSAAPKQLQLLNTWVSRPSTTNELVRSSHANNFPTGCSAKAVTHQLSSLKKDVEALKKGDFAPSSAPATPKSTGNCATSPRKRKTKDANGGEGEEPGSPSPTKKTKGAAKKKGTAVKKSDEKVNVEESGGDEVGNGEESESRNGEHDD